MDAQTLEKHKKLQAGYALQAARKRESFFRHALLVSSSIFGILISLHSNSSQCLYIQLVFSLSVVLLACGILITGLALYDHANLSSRLRELHYKAVDTAGKAGDTDIGALELKELKRTLFCERCSLALFVCAIILLTVYIMLLTLFY
jgi:hypothetical protein